MVYAFDNFGLHRGVSVKTPRLVTWVRYGVSKYRRPDGLMDEVDFEKLNKEARGILIENENSFIFEDLIKNCSKLDGRRLS